MGIAKIIALHKALGGSGSGGCDCGSGMLTVLVTVEEGILGTSYETDHTAAEIYEAFPNVAFYSVVTLEGEGESSVPSETKILIRPIDVSKSGSSYHLDLANGTGSLEFFAESGDDPFMALDPGSGNVPINY